MTTVQHYRANLRDIYFQLFEVLDIASHSLGKAPFDSMDESTARDALSGLLEVVQSSWAPAFAAGDREGVTLDSAGNVKLPNSYLAALDAYYGGGWNNLELPTHLGGFGAPPSVQWAAFELMAGANPAICFYVLGNQMAKIIDQLGTPAQKQRYVQAMLAQHRARPWCSPSPAPATRYRLVNSSASAAPTRSQPPARWVTACEVSSWIPA